ncbi:MAG: RIP metalloprotease RseP [Nitrospirae bacterium]|nr:RIP metalloprotease RseP [Nitrospirota bacterium]MBF0540813.1 RIP metalloprotease RseP [Nitrospirota bacterium]
MNILYAVILLGVLIFVHEFGHFLFAKLSNVIVLKFSLGFGPKIISKKYGHTEYLLSAVPLGGYVKMLGEDPDDEVTVEDSKRSFSNQPVYKRIAIVAAGPIFNLFFAVVLLTTVFMIGVPRLKATVGEIMPNTPAAKVDLIKGDQIVAIDDKEIKYWDEMSGIIHVKPDIQVTLTIKRGNTTFVKTMTPEKKTVKNIFGEDTSIGLIGIKPEGETDVIKSGPIDAIISGLDRTWDIISMTLIAIVKLFERIIPASTIGGPILIFQMAGKQASAGFTSFLTFMAVISINLGILNLLPVPILDGGHLLFFGIEAVRKKPLSQNVMLICQRVGLALILTLMAFAVYNDFLRVFTAKSIE